MSNATIEWSEEVLEGELRIRGYHQELDHTFAERVSLIGTSRDKARAVIVSHLEQKFADKLAGG